MPEVRHNLTRHVRIITNVAGAAADLGMSWRSVMSGDNDQILHSSAQVTGQRLYRICLFERGAVVPRVQLISAPGDEQAIALANGIDPSAEREIWERHRLVAHFQPDLTSSARSPGMIEAD